MPQDTPSRKLDQYIVRFPNGLRSQIKEAAAENNRSLNAEIIARLESSFEMETNHRELGEQYERLIPMLVRMQAENKELRDELKNIRVEGASKADINDLEKLIKKMMD